MAKWLPNEAGHAAPQGAVISPLLANVYLHHVFDLWADAFGAGKWPPAMSSSFSVMLTILWMGFQHRAEAVRSSLKSSRRNWLSEVRLGTPPGKDPADRVRALCGPQTETVGQRENWMFTFRFTHYCGRRHKTDTFTVWRITSKQRMVAKLEDHHRLSLPEACQRDRISQVGAWLLEGGHRLLPIPCCSWEYRSACAPS